MKKMAKAISVVLAAALLLAVFTPAALAAFGAEAELYYSVEAGKVLDNGTLPTGTGTAADPFLIYINDVIKLTGGVAGTTYTWAFVGLSYPIALHRGAVYEEGSPDYQSPLPTWNETIDEEAMYVVGRDIGTAAIKVTGSGSDTSIYTFYFKVIPPEKDPNEYPDQNDIWTIFKIWWTDLQWTWLYEIHPFLKFCFFTVVGWMQDLCVLIRNCWESLWHIGPVVITEP